MKKNILDAMRKNFRTGEKFAEIHNRKVERLNKQLKDSMVLGFIVDRGITLSKDDFRKITEDDVLDAVLRNYTREMAAENNEIYFCDGVVIPDMGGDLLRLKNLEDENDYWVIWVEEIQKFEEKHIVVYGDSYEQVKKEFVLAAIKQGQEEAVKLMASKRLKGKHERPHVKALPTVPKRSIWIL